MAIEKNPFDKIEKTLSNVVKLPEQIKEATNSPTFEADEDGGVTVDFTEVNIEMEADEPIKEWYGNLAEKLDDSELSKIAEDVYHNYDSDKSSRQEWESMFERGFDLLGLKIQEGTEPVSYTHLTLPTIYSV